MKERPILFSGPMVRAILSGRKTQTRRVAKPGRDPSLLDGSWSDEYVLDPGNHGWLMRDCPYGEAGDRLWVREAHIIFPTYGQRRADGKRWGPWGGLPTTLSEDGKQIAYYREGFDRCDPGRWRPSIHMPRWASRIALDVTGVRVERLQDISEADAIAEGILVQCSQTDVGWVGYWPAADTEPYATAVEAYRALWESINGEGSWDTNPWVWVVEFRGGDHA